LSFLIIFWVGDWLFSSSAGDALGGVSGSAREPAPNGGEQDVDSAITALRRSASAFRIQFHTFKERGGTRAPPDTNCTASRID